MRLHSRGQQKGRPDLNFGDPTGSIDVYRRVCAAANEMSYFPRDPLPPAGLPIVAAVFASVPPRDDWVRTYLPDIVIVIIPP